jgi:hypothetical protein
MDLLDKERRVEEILNADSPPTESLGETTDYRQIALAWARAHGLSFEETLSRLEASGGMQGQRLVDEIRRDPAVEAVVREALNEPLTGDTPTVVEYGDAEYVEVGEETEAGPAGDL